MKDKILVSIGLILTVGFGVLVVTICTLGIGQLLTIPFLFIFLATLYSKAAGRKTAY
jgi:hypothetical protein